MLLDMKLGVTIAIIFYFLAANLEFYINGSRKFGSPIFCIGDNVTLVCSLNYTAHQWQVPSFGIFPPIGYIGNYIQSPVPLVVGGKFTTRLVDDRSNFIRSSLSFTGAQDVSGTSIFCSNGSNIGPTFNQHYSMQSATPRICKCSYTL